MTRAAEQAAEALRNIIENSVPTTSMWMDAQTRQRFDWIEKTATEALAALTAEAGGTSAEIDWNDPGVEHGYVPVTAPSASADRHSVASASRREKSNDHAGGRPAPSPVPPGREALARRLEETAATMEKTGPQFYESTYKDMREAAALLRAPAQAEVEAQTDKELWALLDEAKGFEDSGYLSKFGKLCRDDIVPDLLRRLSLSPAVGTGWQPITSAPKDGTPILVYRHVPPWDVLGTAQWFEVSGIAGWLARGVRSDPPGELGLSNPTHWQPLPLPPAPEEAGT